MACLRLNDHQFDCDVEQAKCGKNPHTSVSPVHRQRCLTPVFVTFLSHRYNIFNCERFDVIAEARASQPSSVMAQSVSLQGEEEKKCT